MKKEKKPNILLIFADQMHKYALGAVSDFVKTPNLDKLAAEGSLFTDAYSNNPVCGPYRGILYSGCYSKDCGVQRNGEALKADEETLPRELSRLGYETSFVGKLHLGGDGNGPVPERYWAGHQHFIGYQCYNGFWDQVCFYDEQGREMHVREHRTDATASLGIERMHMLVKTGKPFLHTVFFQAPHYPEQPREEFAALYEGVTFPLPEQYEPIEPYTPTYAPYSPRPFEKCPDYMRYGGKFQEYLRLYYAMVTQLDANVGKLMEALECLGIADETAVIFSSDHGDMQGSHGLKNKCLPYERSCGVPLIVKLPGQQQQQRRVTVPVSAVDLYPTCMELAGGKSCKQLPGESLLALALGMTESHRPVFAENHMVQPPWYMIRSGQYKLTVNAETLEAMSLFNLKNNPEESRNLISEQTYMSVADELYRVLRREVGGYRYT